ncbi:MAG: MATE family efflux transporter [Firmicutes bacterium]|nr:MATE family efflux transporter [Bacillota bacterium]
MSEESKQQEVQFDEKPLIPTYFKLSLPLVFSSIISVIYNLVDTYFIAQTGNALLVAGVSLCSPIFMILMAFGNIFAQGGSSLIARLLGQKRADDVKRVSAYCFWISIVIGAVIGGLLLLIRDPFLFLLGASQDTLPYAREYGVVLLIGAPFIVLTFIHTNLVRCEGKSTLSMTGTILGAVVNVILDPILIPSMGAMGAAIASVIGYICTDVFMLIVVLRKCHSFSVRPQFTIEGSFFKEIVLIGITAAITNIASSLCIILVNQKLLVFGDDKIAAMGIVFKITMIVNMILVGFSFGGVPLFGFLAGAGEREKVRKLIRFCLLFACSIALVMSALVFVLARPLIGLITPDEVLIEIGIPMLRWQVSGFVFAGVVMLMTCLCQATGKALPALVLSLSRQGVVFVVVLLITAAIFGYTGILMAQPVADAISAVMGLCILARLNSV